MKYLLVLVGMFACVASALAADLHVPSQYPTIQAALFAAVDNDVVIVANGVYADELLPIAGSTTGNTELQFNANNVTLKSANGSNACTIDGTVDDPLDVRPTEFRRLFQIVPSNNFNVRIEGFTIKNGRALIDGLGNAKGGAARIESAVVTFVDCKFESNQAIAGSGGTGHGGAISVILGTVFLEGCSFVQNKADSVAGNGGAIYAAFGAVVATDCEFSENEAANGNGGAVYVEGAGGQLQMTRTFFGKNTATSGGAVFHIGEIGQLGMTTFSNCGFSGNRASSSGRAMQVSGTYFELINSTVTGMGGTCSTGIVADNLDPTMGSSLVRNSIVWGCGAQPVSIAGPSPSIEVGFSLIEGAGSGGSFNLLGATNGGSNIDDNPDFTGDPSSGNRADIHLALGSPCVDAGNNGYVIESLDLAETDRIDDLTNGGIVDMGAFEQHANPLAMIQELKVDIGALVSNAQLSPLAGNLLKLHLTVAARFIDRDRDDLAIASLQTFKFSVDLLVLIVRLSSANAQPLKDSADEIIAVLQGP